MACVLSIGNRGHPGINLALNPCCCLLPLSTFIAPSAAGWQARWVEGGVLQHNWQRDEGLLLDMREITM
eukprot:scaffold15570_cov51-Cyclotella_meneghiniana.AAC.7